MGTSEQRRPRGGATGSARTAGRPRLPPVSSYHISPGRGPRRADEYTPFASSGRSAAPVSKLGDADTAARTASVSRTDFELLSTSSRRPDAAQAYATSSPPTDGAMAQEPLFEDRSAFLRPSALQDARALKREIRDRDVWAGMDWTDTVPLQSAPVRTRRPGRYALSRLIATRFGRRCLASACVAVAVALTAAFGSMLLQWHRGSPEALIVGAVPKIASWSNPGAGADRLTGKRARAAHKRHAAKIALAAVNPPPVTFPHAAEPSRPPEPAPPPAVAAPAPAVVPESSWTPVTTPRGTAPATPAAAAAQQVGSDGEDGRPADAGSNPQIPSPAPGGIAANGDITQLVSFDTAPFPYTGLQPGGKPFLDTVQFARKGHRTWHGVLWADPTYADNKVLVHVPAAFDAQRPGVIVVYFHGYEATLTRDVLVRQKVPAQITQSGANAVLLAPQFAVDARDSSAGHFWEPGGFNRFLDEAARQFARLKGDPSLERSFAKMPVIIVGYSGGFVPAAWALQDAGAKHRVRGVMLLDAVYGEIDRFTDWAADNRSGFLVSAFTSYTQYKNAELERRLQARKVAVSNTLETDLSRGGATFLAAPADVHHADFVTQAWVANPIRDLLARLPDLRLMDAQTASIR